jgi:hypothetical protein
VLSASKLAMWSIFGHDKGQRGLTAKLELLGDPVRAKYVPYALGGNISY